VGDGVGFRVGLSEVSTNGEMEGAELGFAVGDGVGFRVGLSEVSTNGEREGAELGFAVGDGVGLRVGLSEVSKGDDVGEREGAEVDTAIVIELVGSTLGLLLVSSTGILSMIIIHR